MKNHQSSEAEKFHPPKQGTFGWVFSHKDECEATKPIQQLGLLSWGSDVSCRRRTSCHSALATVCDLSLMGFWDGSGWKKLEGLLFLQVPIVILIYILIQIGSSDFQELFFVATSEGQWSVI